MDVKPDQSPVPQLTARVPTRVLCTSLPPLSTIGLGTVKFGRAQGVKYPTPVRIPTDSEARELLARARDLNITLLDTAPAYGTSEARLGELLAGDRNSWTIFTKCGETFEDGASSFDFSPLAIAQSLDRSLSRLRTDFVDGLMLHSDGAIEADLISTGVVDALARAKTSGKVRAVGASTKTLAGALHALEHLDFVMVTLNPQHTDDMPAIAAATRMRKGVLIKKVFSSGHLAQDPTKRDDCLRFALATPGVCAAVVGTTNPAHLAQVAAVASTINPQQIHGHPGPSGT
jgi:aryl-alcohol dehydrogenase-like predicted oxidoreductase